MVKCSAMWERSYINNIQINQTNICLHTAMFIQVKWTVYVVLRCRCWMSRTLGTTGLGVLDIGGKASQPCLTDGGKAIVGHD